MIDAGPTIHASQLGYLCRSRKRAVMRAAAGGGGSAAAVVPMAAARGLPELLIEDLGRIDEQALGGAERWVVAHRCRLEPHRGPMGEYLVGDFTALERPGVYRAVVRGEGAPGSAEASGRGAEGAAGHSTEGPAGKNVAWSYPFVVSDGAWSRLPPLFLDYLHAQRCGDFQDDLRGPCHLDDGVRSDTGAAVDAAGGWHDAGDLRKWVATTGLPVLGLFEARDRLGWFRNNWRERTHEDDILAEASWGIRWILKMIDPSTGMFFEDVGGGGEGRRAPGMEWWYENHAGCCADNTGNYFSDNRRGSGDERQVRVQYNPIAQYVAQSILLSSVDEFHAHYPAFSQLCRDAALRSKAFMDQKAGDGFHSWTSVLSWRLLCALRLHAMGMAHESEVMDLVTRLIGLQSEKHGFWYFDETRGQPYRGIVNAAQPVIALASFIESDYGNDLVARARESLELCRDRFIIPLLGTNPFGMMPFGVFNGAATKGDSYHEWGPGTADGLVYRLYMPEHSPQRVNHGLAAHWTSWAHGLALMSRVLDDTECRDAAFDQLAWLLGCNPLDACAVSGVGYRAITPYSRFHGLIPGGFCNGPRGTEKDEIHADLDGSVEWSTGEYWMAPLANALLALSCLLPPHVLPGRKLG